MEHTAALTWSYLNILTKKRYEALTKVYGGLEKALEHVSEELLRTLGCRQETIYKVLLRLEEFDVERYAAELKRRGISFLSMGDPAYPKKLKEITDPPMFLYSKGDLSILDQPCIALVGTRQMSLYGKRVAQEFSSALAKAGVVTVSGLARGIDGEVAEETLRGTGKTVAVLGHGLGTIFPSQHRILAEKIVESGGLLLSEFALDIEPDSHTFPARNRIIAGLSLGTVVLEAPGKSGALITAELALEYGREVFLIPGQIFDENYGGCHAFLKKGQGHLTTSPEDVIEGIGLVVSTGEANAHAAFKPQSPLEEKILVALNAMPKKIDDLVEGSGEDIGQVNAALTMMELAGAAKSVGNGMWVRR